MPAYNEGGGESMDSCCLPVGLGALACAIAEGLDAERIDYLASAFTVLADQLFLISAQRALCQGKNPPMPE